VKVAVLGAGLQGVCIALELARRGVSVDLVDQDDRPLNRASLRNEGKIHLGLVYAKDASLETADAMLDGALRFRRLLSGWTGGHFDGVARSRPFHYLAARDSLLTPEQLATHYERLQQRYRSGLPPIVRSTISVSGLPCSGDASSVRRCATSLHRSSSLPHSRRRSSPSI
jgi:glycine/D-amino acid oxidase-like deaminating enzyme